MEKQLIALVVDRKNDEQFIHLDKVGIKTLIDVLSGLQQGIENGSVTSTKFAKIQRRKLASAEPKIKRLDASQMAKLPEKLPDVTEPFS